MIRHSIIIACYNKERFIGATLESCLGQTDPSLEVIVVDDQSTDNSVQVVRKVMATDSRVKLIQQKNQGPAAARNTGLKAAKGRYVNFVDADDVLAPRKLEVQGQYLDCHPEIGIALCNGIVIDEEDRVLEDCYLDESKFKGHPPLEHVLFAGGLFPPAIMLCRRDQAVNVGGYLPDREASGCEDLEFFIRLARAGVGYHIISQNLFRYRKVNGSWGSNPSRMTPAHRYVYAKLMRDDVYESACALRYVHGLLRNAQAQIAGQRGNHNMAMLLKLVASLNTKKAKGTPRSIMIWGAGSGGQRVFGILEALSLQVSAFIDSDPNKSSMKVKGLPIVNPPTVLPLEAARRPFIVVASTYAHQIREQITKAGWQPSVDFYVFDFEVVQMLEGMFDLPELQLENPKRPVDSKKLNKTKASPRKKIAV